MNTRDSDDRYHRYDRDDHRYDADGRDGPYENCDHDRYDDGRRGDYACAACGVVRRITRISAGRGDNTGSIIIGAVVGGALGYPVGSGDEVLGGVLAVRQAWAIRYFATFASSTMIG